MKKKVTDRNFLKRPTYPGGNEAMAKFINENIKYPKEALDAKIEGVVQIKLTIDHTGNVIGADLLHSLGHGCDEEALRVGKLLSFYVPKNISMKVRFFKKISITFHLPKKVLKKPVQVNVNFTPSNTGNTSVSYNYTYQPAPKPPDKKKPDPQVKK